MYQSLMKFKGRLGCVVFVRIKRARDGIKFYKLCESSLGYCLNFKIYTGGNDKNVIRAILCIWIIGTRRQIFLNIY